jgi:hypothetical protein
MGANGAIHCFLLQLERRIQKYGCLPDTIYYQVDGGSENSNAASLAMCELLIAKGLTKRIYFTRLMVGHTHEDIDAKFGHLWYFVRLLFMDTMQVNVYIMNCLFFNRLTDYDTFQMYEQKLIEAFSNKRLPFEVQNIFVIPDYVDLLKPHIDGKLSG